MKAQTYLLPVGIQGKVQFKDIKTGTCVKLIDGEIVTFVKMNRSRFIAIRENGDSIRVPVYRNPINSKPYIVAIVGFDENFNKKSIEWNKLKPGDLFYVENFKSTYMFLGDRSPAYFKAIDINTQSAIGLAKNFSIYKIDYIQLRRKFGITTLMRTK